MVPNGPEARAGSDAEQLRQLLAMRRKLTTIRKPKVSRLEGSYMDIAIGSDHAGFDYKERLKVQLQEEGHRVVDFGTDSHEAVDYPDFIRPAARAVADGRCQLGIVLGGSGNGEAMVANRERGIRCAVCWSVESAELARRHNNANMLSLGQRMMDYETARAAVHVWLTATFEGGRHQRRIGKIDVAED